jgi:hypothetical protein
MKHGHRLKLVEVVERGIQSVTEGDLLTSHKKSKNLVILISHNLTAEWSVLADRDEPYITKRLALVRKSPITDGHYIKQVIKKSISVDIGFFDTMLLAPAAFRSLKKLSALLGEKDSEKESITQFYITNMNQYLRDHPDKFKKYALKDSKITLQLFFLLQDSLNELVGDKFKLYRTLASAGVEGFINKNEWFSAYKDELKRKKFSKAFQLIKRSYYGGRNEGFFIGRTKNYPETKNKFWIDIDFSGCYPTAMALCPKIDTEGKVEHIPLKYKIDAKVIDRLKQAEIAPEAIDKAKEALDKSVEEFNQALLAIPNKKTAWTIRTEATVINNKLINRWYRQWETAKQNNDDSIEKYLIPGFARILFKFPADTQFPCLPIRHEKYGLLYALEGETTATATEIVLALEAGAKIDALTSLELPIEKDDNGNPRRFTLPHLKDLALERSRYKKDKTNPKAQVFEKLIKEFMNSFYGKFAQAINTRQNYRPATGEMFPLRESKLSEPCTASLVTSLARAALSATLIGISEFNKGKDRLEEQITVISATTDGLLIGVPAPEGFTVVDEYYDTDKGIPKLRSTVDSQLPKILKDYGCENLIEIWDGYLPIRQMRNSRLEMTGNNEVFEIKHMADEIISVKTRGQIGLLSSGHTSVLARFGLRPPLSEIIDDPEEYKRLMDTGGTEKDTVDAQWILKHIDSIENGEDKIPEYKFITLKSFRDIYESKGKTDLTKKIANRRINTDFDWKRKLVRSKDTDGSAISPVTEPYKNIAEMLRHRDQMEAIRRSGYVARPENILDKISIQGRNTRFRGGEPVTVTRLFLRWIMQESTPLNKPMGTYQAMTESLNLLWEQKGLTKAYLKIWKSHDFTNAKRAKHEAGCIKGNILLEDIVQALSETFGADPIMANKTIFAIEEFKANQTVLIEQAISAIIDGPKNDIEPFKGLSAQGYLPALKQIKDRFSQQLSDEQLEAFLKKPFDPGQRPSYDAKELKRLFYSLGIPMTKAEACAKSIAPPPAQSAKRNRFNPGQKKCTEHFAQAMQSIIVVDMNRKPLKGKKVTERLSKYGLSRNKYYQIKEGRFTPNSIKNTQKNISQIRKMSKSFNLEPSQFIDVLIEK